ncbi:MAG: hypothetical protein K6L75_05245 [Cellvibrionaceae bacterium]
MKVLIAIFIFLFSEQVFSFYPSETKSGITGIDCSCFLTGSYNKVVAPIPQPKNINYYKVVEKNNVLTIHDYKGKQLLRHRYQNNNRGRKRGFSPKGNFYTIQEIVRNGNSDQVYVYLWDLTKKKRLLREVLSGGTGGWGFSKDGRTFLLAGKSNNRQTFVMLTNLYKAKTKSFFFTDAESASWRISPCGDALGVGIKTAKRDSASLISLRTLSNLTGGIGISGSASFSADKKSHYVNNYRMAQNKAPKKCRR